MAKLLPLTSSTPHVQLPLLFFIHEMGVRGYRLFAPRNPVVPNDPPLAKLDRIGRYI